MSVRLAEAFVSRRFDDEAARFRPEVESDDARLTALIRELVPLRGSVLLDLGCGKGRFAAPLREMGAEVVGIDRSRSMLEAAVVGPSYVRGSVLRLPFAAGVFDGVYAVEVLQHIPRSSLGAVFAEARRVLAPDGRFVMIDRNVFGLNAARPWLPEIARKWIDERRGLWMYRPGDPAREHWFIPSVLGSVLRRFFCDVRVEYVLSRDERERGVFRWAPCFRRMLVASASKPGEASDVI